MNLDDLLAAFAALGRAHQADAARIRELEQEVQALRSAIMDFNADRTSQVPANVDL